MIPVGAFQLRIFHDSTKLPFLLGWLCFPEPSVAGNHLMGCLKPTDLLEIKIIFQGREQIKN